MGRTCSTNGAQRNAYRILVGKSEGKRPLGRKRRRWWLISFRRIGLAYVWQNQLEINGNICKIVKERCNDIEKQNMFAELNEKSSLSLYRQVKCEWGKEGYIVNFTRNERKGIIWWKAGIWKLRCIWGVLKKGGAPSVGMRRMRSIYY
jgi:hypothetical protein